MKKIIIPIVIIALAVGGYFGYRYYQSRQAATKTATYQTSPITRGSLIAQVSETGVVSTNQTATLTWNTSGTIAAINVKIGDKVAKNQILGSLDINTVPNNILLAQTNLATDQKALDNLLNSNTTMAQAQSTLATAQQALLTAQQNRTSKDYQRASQAIVDAAHANFVIAENNLKTAQDNFNSVADLSADNLERANAESSLAAAQLTRDKALYNLTYVQKLPDAQEVAVADAQLAVAEANLQDAQRAYDLVKNGPNPDDLKAAQLKVDADKASLDTINIRAPFAGTVTNVISSVGDEVSSANASSVTTSTPSFRIDDLTHLLIDVQVTEIDINKVKLGEKANLTLDAVPNITYQGVVTKVGTVGAIVSSVVNYDVTVELLNPDSNVKTGMTSAVNIITQQIDNILIVPSRAVRTTNGRSQIYLLQNGKAVAVNIVVGSSNDTQSEIRSGSVTEGELVILNPPTTTGGFGGGGGGIRIPAGGGGFGPGGG
ncbi:MAG: efflux RND transporter periplasmic adaptor subunit [Anaerolineaceae bacterium]